MRRLGCFHGATPLPRTRIQRRICLIHRQSVRLREASVAIFVAKATNLWERFPKMRTTSRSTATDVREGQCFAAEPATGGRLSQAARAAADRLRLTVARWRGQEPF